MARTMYLSGVHGKLVRGADLELVTPERGVRSSRWHLPRERLLHEVLRLCESLGIPEEFVPAEGGQSDVGHFVVAEHDVYACGRCRAIQHIVEAVSGEDEIWLLESGFRSRLHVWSKS